MNIIGRRRKFHKIPEMSFKEFKTTSEIAKELEMLNIPCFIPEEEPKVGVIGRIDGKKPGKTVALRADIDALPIEEDESHICKSEHKGNMHACGHDTHIAMLLAAAEELAKRRNEFNGRIYLIFEPAEEIGFGAKYMMRQGNWFNETESVFGMHILIPVGKGKVSVDEGGRLAGSDRFKVRIIGKSGHAGEPDKTVDPIVCASSAIMNLQTLVSRNNSPLDPLTVSICNIKGGSAFNIIPEVCEFEGTIRYYSTKIRDGIKEKIDRVLKGTTESFAANYEMDFIHQVDPLINANEASEIARKAALKIFKEEDIIHFSPLSISDNFSFYAEKKPSCYAFLGTGSDKYKYPHHSSKFDIDESVLENGAKLYIEYALEFLK